MKALKLLQLSPESNWYAIGVHTTKEDMCWAIEFAHTYPDQFRVEVMAETLERISKPEAETGGNSRPLVEPVLKRL